MTTQEFKPGQTVRHKTAKYTAIVKEIYENDCGILTVISGEGDFGKHAPFEIKARELEKYFETIETD